MIFKSAPWREVFKVFHFIIESRFSYLRIVFATTTQKPKLIRKALRKVFLLSLFLTSPYDARRLSDLTGFADLDVA